MSYAKAPNPTILSLVADPANICTLLGVVSGLVGIYFAATGSLTIAAAFGVIAVILDCFDGPIARRTRNRPRSMSEVGLQLDSLADAVCSGVGPAVLIMGVAGWNPLALIPASLVVVAGVTRLAYFNVFGLTGGKFTGLPIFYNPVIVAVILLVVWLFADSAEVRSLSMGFGGLAIAVLNVAPLTVPKLRGRFFYTFLLIAFVLAAILFVVNLQGGAPA